MSTPQTSVALTQQSGQTVRFIGSYMLGIIGSGLASTLSVWLFIEHFSSQGFAVTQLAALLLLVPLSVKYSYYLDILSRKRLVQSCNILILTLLCLLLMVGVRSAWLLISLMIALQFYFFIFFTSYQAMAQNLVTGNYQKLNAKLEIASQLSALFVGAAIFLAFESLSIQYWIVTNIGILLLAVGSLHSFQESLKRAEVSLKKHRQMPKKSFRWFAKQPILFPILMAIAPFLVIMLSNEIKPIFIYEVLKRSPEILSLVTLFHVAGAVLAGVLSNYQRHFQRNITKAWLVTVINTLVLALFPSLTVLCAFALVQGFVNSANRVAAQSLVMNHLDNTEIGTFNGLRNSLVIMLRVLCMLTLSSAFPMIPYEYVIWLLPLALGYLPVMYYGLKRLA